MLRMPNRELLDKVEEYFYTNENWIKKDGIVDEVAFAQARVKILWILREMNEKEGYRQSGGDMRKDWRACTEKNNLNPYHAPQGGYSKTYALIIKTSGAILKNEWSVGGYQSWCREVLPQIAIINAKKMAGGAHIDPFAMQQYYKNDADLLKDQIAGINPDIIINTNHSPELLKHLNVQDPRQEVSCALINPARKGSFYSYRQKDTGRIILEVQHTNTRCLTHGEYIKLVQLCLAKQGFQFT